MTTNNILQQAYNTLNDDLKDVLNVKIDGETIANIAYQLTEYESCGYIDIDDYLKDTLKGLIENGDIDLIGDFFEYCLEHYYDCYYSMEMFDEVTQEFEPFDLACMIAYGDFNPHHEYFYYNGYGNIETCDGWKIIDELKNDGYFLQWYIDTVADLSEFNAYREELEAITRHLVKCGF